MEPLQDADMSNIDPAGSQNFLVTISWIQISKNTCNSNFGQLIKFQLSFKKKNQDNKIMKNVFHLKIFINAMTL
jgi:hypothetical protein